VRLLTPAERDAIVKRFQDGESIGELARAFQLGVDGIEEVLRGALEVDPARRRPN